LAPSFVPPPLLKQGSGASRGGPKRGGFLREPPRWGRFAPRFAPPFRAGR